MDNKMLFDDSDGEEVSLKTENEYAKKYDKWREKEELHKLEQKYGSGGSESDSEDESDAAPEVSEEIETQFLKTLSLLKTKDPRIYNPNYKFFNEKIEKEKEKNEESKKVTFADSEDDDDDNNTDIFTIEKKAEIDEPADKKTAQVEGGKLKNYLTGKVDHIDHDVEKDLAPLKSLWSDPKLSEGEAFLRDYVLNKKYLAEEDDAISDTKVRDDEDLEADEQTVEEQGKFERAYNFRFEEPDDEYLKRYPRTMNFIRPKDERRSRKRVEVRTRKEQEKLNKMEGIARLKALKMKEIQEKIAKIKEVTGNEDLAFKDEDIEGVFNPEEHDRRMKAIFDEQYYGDADDEKPVFPDLDEELEIENWEKYEKEYNEDDNGGDDNVHCEDDDFNMDADYNPKAVKSNLLEELKRNMGKKRRNRKRKSKLAELLSEEKPTFTPDIEKTYSQFMEEYYKMDCEDVIGDLPTRFKYREVVPNDYGLTVEEILLADDKELTQWVPLKRIVKYRPENIEKGDVKTYQQKAADADLKKKVLPSLFQELPEEPEILVPTEVKSKKKRKKKKKDKSKENGDAPINSVDTSSKENVQNDSLLEENFNDVSKDLETKNSENSSANLHEDNKQVPTNVPQKKHKKKNTSNVEINNSIETTAEAITTNVRERQEINEFMVEDIDETNKMASTQGASKGAKRKANTSLDNIVTTKKKTKKENRAQNGGKFKRKEGFKNKQNNANSSNSNPLSKLSDERLKAYGLNPKKYRSFLKYKKF